MVIRVRSSGASIAEKHPLVMHLVGLFCEVLRSLDMWKRRSTPKPTAAWIPLEAPVRHEDSLCQMEASRQECSRLGTAFGG